MNKEKCSDAKYAKLMGIAVTLLILCSTIVNFKIIDVIYLLFLGFCVIRYIIICRED